MKGRITLLVSNAAGKIIDCPAIPVYMIDKRKYGGLLHKLKDTSNTLMQSALRDKERMKLSQHLIKLVTQLAKRVSVDKTYLTEYIEYLKQVQKVPSCKTNFDKFIAIVVSVDQNIKYRNKHDFNHATVTKLDMYVSKISTYIISNLDVSKDIINKIAREVRQNNNTFRNNI